MKKKRRDYSQLSKKYLLISVSAVLLCLAVFAVVQNILMDDIFLFAVKQDMIGSSVKISEINFKKDDYKKILSDIEIDDNLYIEIYRPRDTLFYTTKSNEAVYGEDETKETVLKPRIMKILQRTENEDGSYFELRKEYFSSAQYIVYGCVFEEKDMALEMYYSFELITENAEVASTVTFLLCILVMILLISTSVRVGFMVFMPLKNMIANTKRMANLDFSARCPSYPINDLNELSMSINTLSDSLSVALEKLKDENRKLETDILYERRLEKARKSFISNVSHELKTPIAIIKGYAEGMKMGIGCDSTEEFCDIIIDESDKMNNLIIRLMEYMKLNTGAYKLYSTEFNLVETLGACAESLQPRMDEKEITLDFSVNPSFVAESDAVMVQNIFTNYLSNAISHADFDKIISVTAEDVGKSYRVRVFNTGKQIPGTDIENVWQSFYRADKSHSREEGRFGLGLSFVASIQQLTGEKFGVENKVDGVEFWFDVRKKI